MSDFEVGEPVIYRNMQFVVLEQLQDGYIRAQAVPLRARPFLVTGHIFDRQRMSFAGPVKT